MATGQLDAQGIWQYGEDDPVSPLSAFMNLGMGPVSAQFAADRARLTTLEAAGSGDVALGSFAPQWTGLTLGTGGSTPYAKYAITRKVCDVFVRAVLGTSNFSVSDPTLTLPVAPVAAWSAGSRVVLGTAQLYDTSAGISGQYDGLATLSGAAARIGFRGVSAGSVLWQAVTASTPFAWAAGDEIRVHLRYPVA